MSLAGAGRAAARRAGTRMRSVESCILKLLVRACNSRKCGLSMSRFKIGRILEMKQD
jgi:hypothetical protein